MANKPPFVGKKVKLEDLCTKGISALRQKDLINNGPYPVYGASGIVGTMAEFQNNQEYVAVVKDGAGVGRAMTCLPNSSVLGTMQALLPKDGIDRDYLFHLIRSLKLGEGFSGSTIPHIYFKDYGKVLVKALTTKEQEAIANVLNEIEISIKQREQIKNKLDQLVKSQFVEMFGDPTTNPMRWPSEKLGNLGNLKNGVNFKATDSGCKIKCLGVGDFKNRNTISDMDLINTTTLNGDPNENQILKDGDIVFVRSNGNKQLVGRCLAVFPGDTQLTFSGFCIRFRNESNYLLLDFLLGCLKSDPMRKALAGRGANIQNLNQKLLSKVEIPLPPLHLQQQFADFVAQVDKLRFVAQRAAEKYNELIAQETKATAQDKQQT